MADEFESIEDAAARRSRGSRGSEAAEPRPSADLRRSSDDRPPAARLSGDGARRLRRASATDAGEGWARRFSEGAHALVGDASEPRVSTEEEEDAALARASLLLLHGRFQAAVATHVRWNDAVRVRPRAAGSEKRFWGASPQQLPRARKPPHARLPGLCGVRCR